MKTSESTENISKALVAAQTDIKNPANTATAKIPTKSGGGYSYKYAPLPDILNEVRPLLAKHGLAVLQDAGGDGRNVTVTTRLIHTSGEWIESDPLTLIADGATAQSAGSAITYGRRYALASMLGISSEDDDDGAVVSHHKQTQSPAKKTPAKKAPAQKGNGNPAVEKEKLQRKFFAIARGKGMDDETIKAYIFDTFAVDSTSKLTTDDLTEAIETIAGMESK